MSEAKFTGGEWEVADGTKIGEQVLFVHVPTLSNKGKVVCRLTRVVDTHVPLSEQDIANAHLIAAAPKMYAMLEDFVKTKECKQEWLFEMQSTIESLLAKARGE